MEHAVTVGMVVDFVLIMGGAFVVLGLAFFILSIFAEGFKH